MGDFTTKAWRNVIKRFNNLITNGLSKLMSSFSNLNLWASVTIMSFRSSGRVASSSSLLMSCIISFIVISLGSLIITILFILSIITSRKFFTRCYFIGA